MRYSLIAVFLLLMMMPLSGCIGDSKESQELLEESQEVFQPENQIELQYAVGTWASNPDAGNYSYGEIQTWDTSLITNMSGVFMFVRFSQLDVFRY
jgi:hypothetical protein